MLMFFAESLLRDDLVFLQLGGQLIWLLAGWYASIIGNLSNTSNFNTICSDPLKVRNGDEFK